MEAGHGQVLELLVLVEALGSALAAEAGLLDPAEWCGRVRGHALVDADQAGLASWSATLKARSRFSVKT